MDAGVPTKAPVAGVAMGLIKEEKSFVVLTDILGDEDHLGDMDFKVAGTADGVTALQMDIKIFGITREIMAAALAQARDGRLHILGEMNKVLSKPREKMSDWAPTIITIKIDPEKIRDVIGKGGAVIRAITEETGATIDIENDGTVKIASVDGKAGRAAVERIELITADVEVGRIYEGKVVRLMDFGAFVAILPGRDGLVHISQISNERVERVSDKLKEGDVVRVKVLEVDRQGRVRLSMRDVERELDRRSPADPGAPRRRSMLQCSSAQCHSARGRSPAIAFGTGAPSNSSTFTAASGWAPRSARRPSASRASVLLVDDHGQVVVPRRSEPQRALQMDVRCRGVEQVDTAHDCRDALSASSSTTAKWYAGKPSRRTMT